MMIIAQWFGGPWDGLRLALPDYADSVVLAVAPDLHDALANPEPAHEVGIETKTCVLRKTEHGFLIVWTEP